MGWNEREKTGKKLIMNVYLVFISSILPFFFLISLSFFLSFFLSTSCICLFVFCLFVCLFVCLFSYPRIGAPIEEGAVTLGQ